MTLGINKQTRPFFLELHVLDLSSNSFNGSIPTQFLKQLFFDESGGETPTDYILNKKDQFSTVQHTKSRNKKER
jgi:hypothetical protein